MAKSDRKLHEARMAGAAWLMNVIKTQGMEAARKKQAWISPSGRTSRR